MTGGKRGKKQRIYEKIEERDREKKTEAGPNK